MSLTLCAVPYPLTPYSPTARLHRDLSGGLSTTADLRVLHCALLAFNHHWAASYLLQRDLTPLQQPLATLHPTPAARHAPGPDCRPDSERVTAAPAAPSPAARVVHSATATRTPSRTLTPAAPASTHCLQQHPRSGPAPSQPRVHPPPRYTRCDLDGNCVDIMVVCVQTRLYKVIVLNNYGLHSSGCCIVLNGVSRVWGPHMMGMIPSGYHTHGGKKGISI